MTSTPVEELEAAGEQALAFVAELGIALTAAGNATTLVHTTLSRAAASYGYDDLRILVLPTFLILQTAGGRAAIVDLTRRNKIELRLDQIGKLFDLADAAERGEIAPSAGRERLREIRAERSRFALRWQWLGHGVVALGVALLLGPSLVELALSGGLGVVTGCLKSVMGSRRSLEQLRPVACALVASVPALLALKAGLDIRMMNVLIAAVVTLLPGALLTTSMIELTAGDIISGTSRLISGLTTVLLLFFGGIIASLLVGDQELTATYPESIGWWAPLLGVAVFTGGVYLHLSAPRGSLLWLALVAYLAWLSQASVGELLGAYPGAFVGAMLIMPLAIAIHSLPGAPQPWVSFTPAFWLLVPGSLALKGLTKLAASSPQAGIDDFLTMVLTLTSIALGIIVGIDLVALYREHQRR